MEKSVAETRGDEALLSRLASYPLLEALLQRRSRRFGRGMHLDGGPLSFESQRSPQPLSLEEEAALAFAACGVTGHALAELPYRAGSQPESGGGNIMVHFVGRTVASGDALHVVSLFVINDEGVWLLKRPQDFPRAELPELIEAAHDHRLVELYERSRVRIAQERLDIPREVPYRLNLNKWSANVPGTTVFLPVNELTALYINVLLTVFDEEYGYFLVDERNGFRPAGVGPFARSRGGHLYDDPAVGRASTVGFAESWLHEFAALEQGAILQNLGLMAEALGIGGFAHFAAHPFVWLQTLGFRMQEPRASRIYGLGPVRKAFLRLLNKDIPVPTAVGLEKEDDVLLKPFCPPYYSSMEEAVRAFVEYKYAAGRGTFRDGGEATAWRDGESVQARIPRYSDEAIAATIAYCQYIYDRYGRFPAHNGPFRTVLAYQAHHVDPDFYARFYRDGALNEAQRNHPGHHD